MKYCRRSQHKLTSFQFSDPNKKGRKIETPRVELSYKQTGKGQFSRIFLQSFKNLNLINTFFFSLSFAQANGEAAVGKYVAGSAGGGSGSLFIANHAY